jgi:antitoxin ParD1/3/4
MITLEISLPDDMMVFLEDQATAKGLATPSEYLQHLILLARQDAQQAELEARFTNAIHALERGEPNPMTGEDWKRLQSRTLGKHAPHGAPPRTTST